MGLRAVRNKKNFEVRDPGVELRERGKEREREGKGKGKEKGNQRKRGCMRKRREMGTQKKKSNEELSRIFVSALRGSVISAVAHSRRRGSMRCEGAC